MRDELTVWLVSRLFMVATPRDFLREVFTPSEPHVYLKLEGRAYRRSRLDCTPDPVAPILPRIKGLQGGGKKGVNLGQRFWEFLPADFGGVLM